MWVSTAITLPTRPADDVQWLLLCSCLDSRMVGTMESVITEIVGCSFVTHVPCTLYVCVHLCLCVCVHAHTCEYVCVCVSKWNDNFFKGGITTPSKVYLQSPKFMDLSLWFFRLVSKPRNGLAFILNTFQIFWVAPAWIQYSRRCSPC